MYAGKRRANGSIAALEQKYREVLAELYSSENARGKGSELVSSSFKRLRSFAAGPFTVKEERAVLALGEMLSTTLFQYHLEESKIDSTLLQALGFMRTGENEEPDLEYIETNFRKELAKYPGGKLFITQGYICRNAAGEIDNLKRGGSDYTATILGAAVRAEEIQIWTDIDGMHNSDPRIVEKTSPIAELSFDEAAELAYFGAKILHPTCILPAKTRNISVRLLNTLQPGAKGTLISGKAAGDGIKAVAAKDGITAIKIKSGRMLLAYGFLRAVLRSSSVINPHRYDRHSSRGLPDHRRQEEPRRYRRRAERLLQRRGGLRTEYYLRSGKFYRPKEGYALKILEALRYPHQDDLLWRQ